MSDLNQLRGLGEQLWPPSFESLVTTAKRRNRRAAVFTATCVAVVALVSAAVFNATHTDRAVPPASPPDNSDVPWGPDVPLYMDADGLIPFSGGDLWSHPDRVEVFTIVEDGVVYLPAHRTDIVFETWENETSVIGSMPLGEREFDYYGLRDVVGDPLSDVVGWVENGDSDAAELVLTEASTGDELARAPMPSGANFLMSVGEEFVYFLNSTRESTSYPSRDSAVWSWDWTTGQSPEQVDVGDDRVLDVKGDVWAMQHGDELRFEDSSGQLTVPSHLAVAPQPNATGGV